MPIDTVRALIGGACNVVALTGAGISAESGIPTFRGAGGLWRNYKPESLANTTCVFSRPEARVGVVRLAPRHYSSREA
jgi:NAD-dependent SIR2 family protein deacetylase